jgi:uncharacterized protein (DUF2336 family)
MAMRADGGPRGAERIEATMPIVGAAMLTEADVERLRNDRSVAFRVELSQKVAASLGRAQLSDKERAIAYDIVRIMARDIEVRVRQAVAAAIAKIPGVSREIALTFAIDTTEVAQPILLYSTVLSDPDLISIVRSSDWEKQAIVAQRAVLSEAVSSALIDTRDSRVVAPLAANDGAAISEAGFSRILDWFSADDVVKAALVQRTRLPLVVSEKLVALVSERLRLELLMRHPLPEALATDLLLESREQMALGLLKPDENRSDLLDLALHLKSNGRLTQSLILRAACCGEMEFVHVALAVAAGIPMEHAQSLMADDNPLGLRRLCDKAGVGPTVFPAIRIALRIYQDAKGEGLDQDVRRCHRCMIERVLTQLDDEADRLPRDDVAYLTRILHRYCEQEALRQ